MSVFCFCSLFSSFPFLPPFSPSLPPSPCHPRFSLPLPFRPLSFLPSSPVELSDGYLEHIHCINGRHPVTGGKSLAPQSLLPASTREALGRSEHLASEAGLLKDSASGEAPHSPSSCLVSCPPFSLTSFPSEPQEGCGLEVRESWSERDGRAAENP